MRKVSFMVACALLASALLAPTWAKSAAGVAYTDFANIFTSNQRINAGLGVNVAPGATGTLSLSSSMFERSRSTAVGEWTNVTYSSGNFSSSAGTWTVDSGDQQTYAYTLVGKTMTLQCQFWTTSVSVSAPVQLRVAIPGGFTSNQSVTTPAFCDNGAGSGLAINCSILTASGLTYVAFELVPLGPTTWPIQTNLAYQIGTIIFEVQ